MGVPFPIAGKAPGERSAEGLGFGVVFFTNSPVTDKPGLYARLYTGFSESTLANPTRSAQLALFNFGFNTSASSRSIEPS